MEYEEIVLDDVKLNIVTKLEPEYKDDMLITDLDSTLDLTNILSEVDNYESL